MDFTAIFDGVTKSPTGAMLVMALIAVGWLAKKLLEVIQEHAKETRAQHEAHLATAMQVAPLATKLAECVSLFERVILPRGGGAP